MRLLLEVKPKIAVIKLLFPAIIDWAVDSGDLTSIGLAKDLLLSYSKELWVKEALQSEVKKYLTDNDDWHYRRIAEIYKLLHYKPARLPIVRHTEKADYQLAVASNCPVFCARLLANQLGWLLRKKLRR